MMILQIRTVTTFKPESVTLEMFGCLTHQEEPPGLYGACGLLETASVSVSVCDKVFRLHLWLMAAGLETVSDD